MWRRTVSLEKLKEAPVQRVVVGDRALLVVATEEGPRVYEDRCPHMDLPLGTDCLEEGEIVCPWHFWRFEVSGGRCTDAPAQLADDYIGFELFPGCAGGDGIGAHLASHPSRVRGGWVEAEIETPLPAPKD